jgi:hypothetical protein
LFTFGGLTIDTLVLQGFHKDSSADDGRISCHICLERRPLSQKPGPCRKPFTRLRGEIHHSTVGRRNLIVMRMTVSSCTVPGLVLRSPLNMHSSLADSWRQREGGARHRLQRFLSATLRCGGPSSCGAATRGMEALGQRRGGRCWWAAPGVTWHYSDERT